MNIRRALLRLLGLGHGDETAKRRIDETEADSLHKAINAEVKKHAAVQRKLAVTTLDDIDNSEGVRNTVRGVLDRLERDQQK